MKKIILILVLVFAIAKTNGQSLDKIKRQNVFFILLNHKDELAEYSCSTKVPLEPCLYYFYSKKNKELFEYSFMYTIYPNADLMRNNLNKTMLLRIDKSFLRKNKDIIITREFMEKQGLDTMLTLLYDNRTNSTIFLINTADTKNGKILLREVEIDYIAQE